MLKFFVWDISHAWFASQTKCHLLKDDFDILCDEVELNTPVYTYHISHLIELIKRFKS